jgi:hypothetical protein
MNRTELQEECSKINISSNGIKPNVIKSVYCSCENHRKSAADNSICKRRKKKLKQ